MIGKQDRWQEDLFVACSLKELVPADHVLRRVDRVLDLSWLRQEVADLYCTDNGRPSIDPEAAVRLMLAGFFHNITQDRRLMREAQVNLAIRWFAGYRLDERLPDHSSLTRIRQRWGPERFRRIFTKTVEACCNAGLVDTDTVHIDATLIRANVSWESISRVHAERVLKENDANGADPPSDDPPKGKPGRPKTRPPKVIKRSSTDPDATLSPSGHGVRMQPSFKQHTAVDDQSSVIVDVELTTGESSEGKQLIEQIERIEETTGRKIERVTADKGYAHSENYRQLEDLGIEAIIPPQMLNRGTARIPLRRFHYDAKNGVLKCVRGRKLKRMRHDGKGWIYHTQTKTCRGCPLATRCLTPGLKWRAVKILDGYEALLRARRKRLVWGKSETGAYRRHRWRVEGIHGEEKTQHGLARALRRGLANVAIQVYLTAAVVNLKRLAAALGGPLALLRFLRALTRAPQALQEHISRILLAPRPRAA